MAHSHVSSTRKVLLAGIAALALGAGTVASTAPAEAFGGHGGGFGGGASFHPSMGGGLRGGFGGGINRAGFGGGFGRVGVARGGRRGRGLGLAGLGLGLAAGGLYGATAGDGYADNGSIAYGAYDGCFRTVLTADGYRTVNVCD